MITSLNHDKAKYIRALSVRKHRIREGRCVIEGARLIDDALAAHIQPDWIFAAERLLPRARATLAHLRSLGIEVIEVSDAVMKACSDTETPQGLMAVVPLPRLSWPADPKLIVIADALRDPGNLGTLLRSCAAADVDGVLLAPNSVDAYNPKVVRGAMGAHFRLPLVEAEWAAIADRVQGMTLYLAAMDGDQIYTDVDWTRPSALIVGGEAEGASEDALKLPATHISIPLAREVESLNAAVAASVILFEAKRQRSYL
jgi:TrmH family RNA methyltransferase